MKKLCCIAVFFVVLFTASCSPYERVKGVHLQLQDPAIRQRYGGEMGALADELKQAGVTMVISPVLEGATAYYPSDLLPQSWEYGTQLLAFRHELRRRNIRFAAYVPVFKDAYTQRSQPVLQAVNDYGAGVRGWVCPSRPEYRSYKLQIINEIMLIIQPDAIYLDYCFYPAENTQNGKMPPNNPIRSSCFCAVCLRDFSDYTNVDFPANASTADQASHILNHYRKEWTLWRSDLITAYVETIRRQVHAINSSCRIFLESSSWPENYCNTGLQQIYGLDIKNLQSYVDAFVLNTLPETDAGKDSLLAAAFRKSADLGLHAIPSFQIRNYLRNDEERFRSDLQLWQQNFIVYDWGQLLNNRHFLNIFISEP